MNFDDLFHDAVDHVEPRPGLDAIRARISEEPAMNRRWIAPLAAAAAVAAVVGGFVALQGPDEKTDTAGPVGTPTQTTTVSPSPTETTAPPETSNLTVPAYFAGDTPHGPRLYREFFRLTCVGPDCVVDGAVEHAVVATPGDPDYRTLWPAGAKVNKVAVDPDLIVVDLGGDVHDRPDGMSTEQARIAVQQVVYTAQAAVGKGRLPVQLLLDGKHTDTVLGQPASEALANDPVLDTLSLVSLSTPDDEQEVTGGKLEVSGVANSFEATVGLRIQRYEGTAIVYEGSAMATECCGDKLFPFKTTIDVSAIPPGRYLLMARTDEASDEGPGPFVDTKVIDIR